MSKDLKSKSVLNVFDNMDNEYVEYFGDDWEFIKEISEFASCFDKEDKILDLGCGSGYITNYLVEKGLNATGIDFSSEMIKIAKKKYPKLNFLLDDFLNIEKHFDEDSIDGLIAIYSLYFIPKEQFEVMLKSLSKVLKNGGLFLFVTQIGTGEDYITTPLMTENDIKEELYVNYYMKDELEEILNRNNFIAESFVAKYDHDEKEITDSGRYIVLAKNKK